MIHQLPVSAVLAERPATANAIAVASGKGGVGKTWLSITLSQALAQQGERVLLFDGDLGLANVDVQLGLAPEADLASVVERGVALHRAVTSFHEGGFDVVAGQSGTGGLAALGGTKLQAVIDGLSALGEHYDHVILDLGAGVERTVRYLAARSAMCLVVTTDEPTALTDAYAFIKLSAAQDKSRDLRIVVNNASSIADGERTYGTLLKACKSFLGIDPPLAGVIRRDSHVKESIRAQSPILTRFPSSAAAADVTAMARRLLAS